MLAMLPVLLSAAALPPAIVQVQSDPITKPGERLDPGTVTMGLRTKE